MALSLSLSLSLLLPCPLRYCKFQNITKIKSRKMVHENSHKMQQCSPLSLHLLTHSLTHSLTVFNFTVTTTTPPSDYSSSQYVRPNGNFLLLSVVVAQFSPSLSLARAEPIKENLCGLFFSLAMMLSPRVL
jgi:hypothetical protein